jgi:hypothetical protein
MSYYIYCIGDGKHFKIGHSKNVNARLKALQNGNPNILHIFFKYRINNKLIALRVERACHHRLWHYGLVGEWFENIDVINIYDYIVKTDIILSQFLSILKDIKRHEKYQVTVLPGMRLELLANIISKNKFKSSSEIRTYIMKYHLDDICAYGDYSINELVQNGRIEYRNGYYIEI